MKIRVDPLAPKGAPRLVVAFGATGEVVIVARVALGPLRATWHRRLLGGLTKGHYVTGVSPFGELGRRAPLRNRADVVAWCGDVYLSEGDIRCVITSRRPATAKGLALCSPVTRKPPSA